jgi:hypothetical protein
LITPIGQTRSSFALTSTSGKSETSKARLSAEAEAAPSTFFIVVCALLYALAIVLSIKGTSLWTDEAFSAWAASHRDLPSLLHSLRIGDSSDLQVGTYYIWLFGWVQLFGESEYALRAANIPFVVIFAFALVWASCRIFRSRWAWLPAGMLPFIWQFASEVRGYMASLAFSTACFGLLIALTGTQRSKSEARTYTWLLLGCSLTASMFHMLFLLAVPPLVAIGFILQKSVTPASLSSSLPPSRDEWRSPAKAFVLPFLVLGAFLAWTFTRADILYDYPKPGLRQMASVTYEILGFGGFGPNRKFSLDFRAHEAPLILGGGVLLAGLALIGIQAFRERSPVISALVAALFAGVIETLALAFGTGKQPDARHLAALVPILLFVVMAVIARPHRNGLVAAVFLASAWIASDIRTATIAEYQKEDFRGAIAAAIATHDRTGADIAVESDPVAAAYYGLAIQGETPCYPFVEDCATSLDEVTRTNAFWRHQVPAQYAARWDRNQILAWLNSRSRPVAVIVQTERSRLNTPWFQILAERPGAPRQTLHGFEIVFLSR